MGRRTLILIAIVAVVAVGVALAATTGRGPIEQPIPFPHDVHAGTYEIPCLYCHSSAERSVSAGIPSMEVCAGCHLPGGVPMVAADSPGVRVLTAYWNAGEQIPWKRVYKLPDHARFPHMMHVSAGVECQECHGAVETMEVVEQASSLRMGWCLECHRERAVRTDCFVCHY
jgi:hypothetical protein